MNFDETRFLNGKVPALMYFRESPEAAARRGTVLFWHGLTVNKEINAKELESIAERGFLAIGIDNAGHGGRERIVSPDDGRADNHVFLGMVCETVEEVPALIDELVAMRLAYPGKVGACGISMGGFIAYGAVAYDRRIAAAAPVLGSPYWECECSPHTMPEKFWPAAVLSQNAGDDEVVDPAWARAFHITLEKHYAGAPENIKYIEYPGERHMVSEAAWNVLWKRAVDWLDEKIPRA